jgi:hypothetical protein
VHAVLDLTFTSKINVNLGCGFTTAALAICSSVELDSNATQTSHTVRSLSYMYIGKSCMTLACTRNEANEAVQVAEMAA